MAAQRILFVIMDLGGGAGVYCRILAKALRKQFPGDFHISLLVTRNRGFLAGDNEVFDNIEIQRAQRLPGRLLAMKRTIKATNPDRIICVGTFANLVVPVMAERGKIILTVHGNYTLLLRESKYPWLLRPLLKWRFGRNRVVAPAGGVADDLTEHFSARHVTVIHHGVNAEELTRLAEAGGPDRPTEPYILAVGRLAKQKDYPTMLSAYATARSQGLTIPLVIIGGGPELDPLQLLAKDLRIGDYVRFLGHRENPFPYMKGAAFLVLSSEWEGFGLVLIEAMSLGTPIISTDCPSGPGEILGGGKYGKLVPVGDWQAMANAMMQLRDTDTHNLFSELAKERSADFTAGQMAVAYRNLLRESDIVRS